jgi:hypothetical protein
MSAVGWGGKGSGKPSKPEDKALLEKLGKAIDLDPPKHLKQQAKDALRKGQQKGKKP